MKIIVTGGAGFIGSHIVEYWDSQKAEVHVIDNLRSGYKSNIEKFNKVIFHKASITDRDFVFKVLQNADYVFHLAAFVSVPESIEKPDECAEININGLLNVLDACKECGVRKIVFSSSAAIYGDNPLSPKTVDMKPDPKSPYGTTKLKGENYLKMYNRSYHLDAVSLRYFNVFGPRQDPNSLYSAAIPVFVNKAIHNEPITVYGNGEQTRDFIFVKDVVNANILAATNDSVNGVLNVANGSAISINEIVKLVVEETNSRSKIIYEKQRAGDIKHSLASIEETKRALNFSPVYNLIAGMRETIKYFAEKMKN